MVYLYIAYFLYIVFACRYIYADYSDDIKKKRRSKIPVSLLYLAVAILAFFLNTVDGKLVAARHFSWIFAGMLLCFYGDMLMLNAEKSNRSMIFGMSSFLLSHIVFATYFTIYLYQNAGQLYNLREIIIFAVGILFGVFFITRRNLDFGRNKVLVIIFIIVSVYMIAKASSLIEFMNTSVSWPTFLGVFFAAVSDIFLAYKYYSKREPKLALGVALVLYYTGMAILPFGIYYI